MAADVLQLSMNWVEKYRPKKVDDVCHQEEAKKMLNQIIKTGNMPHLLFYGPPGSGKTSAALALVRELFGREECKTRLLELNASDERGINVVRDRIKNYTKTNTAKGKINPETGREMPCWKIVLLDEADMMTGDAQSALRRIIEAYSKNTRFILICNYAHKIIDPIFSRCSQHRFEPVSESSQIDRLRDICKAEKVDIDGDALNVLFNISSGDMRKAINLLQSSACIFDTITSECVLEVSGHPQPEVVLLLLQACAESADAVTVCVDDIISQGWDISLILVEMLKQVVESPQMQDIQKAMITTELAAKDYALLQGSSAYLQLMSLCLKINAILRG